ncbi:MAG: tRNA dimethylallyltransferase, partial [Patescibacteria group bacterium]
LIDILDPRETYSANDFVRDATEVISSIRARGKRPILAGGTHFYFDALLYGLPGQTPPDQELRDALEERSIDSLFEELRDKDPRRAARIDQKNKRRLIRALEIIAVHGQVPERSDSVPLYAAEWIVLNPEREELRARLETRLVQAFERGLAEEVERVRAHVGDERLHELGLEYRIIGEYLRGERDYDSLIPTLAIKLWHYARHQKAWLARLTSTD